jgi:hypothetical protein
MEDNIYPPVTHVERIRKGIIVTFDDGSCAIYSHTLLFAMRSQAVVALGTEEED